MRFPHAFFCCLRGEQNHAFSFMEHEELDQHETHERLAETHAVAEESAAAPTAFNDFVLAYDALKAMPCVVANNLTGQPLGGKTLAPGIYCFPSTTADLTTGTLTLDGGGDSNAVWVFQVGTGITTGTASVAMINGGQQRNGYWQGGTPPAKEWERTPLNTKHKPKTHSRLSFEKKKKLADESRAA